MSSHVFGCIATDQCDLVAAHFGPFAPKAAMDDAFQSFDLKKSRLDILFHGTLEKKMNF